MLLRRDFRADFGAVFRYVICWGILR